MIYSTTVIQREEDEHARIVVHAEGDGINRDVVIATDVGGDVLAECLEHAAVAARRIHQAREDEYRRFRERCQ